MSWGIFSTVHWANRIQDTDTLSWMYIFIYLLPLSHRHGDIKRYSWVIETLTNGRKKKVQSKGSVERKLHGKGLCNNKNNYKSKHANINETLNQM